MEERRKIIIPTNADPDETLSRRPYFNTESTKAARPVVPLADAPHQPAAKSRRWLMIASFVLVAVAAGGATGLALSIYHNRQPAESSSAVQPVAGKASPSSLKWVHIPEDETLAQADTEAPAPEGDEAATAPPSTPAQEAAPNEPPARVNKPSDKQQQREAERDNQADRRDDRRAENRDPRDDRASDDARDRRRDDRRARRGRNDRNKDDDLPEDPLTRVPREGIHRVREIFEGTP